MRLFGNPSLVTTLMICGVSLSLVPIATAQEDADKVSILPLHVSSNRLSADVLDDLTEVVLGKLKKYPAYRTLDVPDTDPMDLMIDAGCLDFGPDCLAGIGESRGADKVLYTEVREEEGGGFFVQISMVDVESRDSMTPEGGTEVRENLNQFLGQALEKVLGPEPVPETVLSRVDLSTNPAGAEIYLDGDFVGVSPVTLRLKKGRYKLRANRVGYEEAIREIDVEAGKKTAKNLEMTRIVVAVPVGPVPVKEREIEKKPYYKTWWFWTTIGAVVVAGGATAAVLATRGGGGGEGSARFTLDAGYAPRDVTLYPTR